MSRERVIVKVLVLGAANGGKTSLIERYCHGDFSGVRRPTLGCDYKTKILDLEEKEVVLQVWDTAGQERFQATLGATYYRNADGCVLVYDCTSEKSVDQLAQWKAEALLHNPTSEHFPVVVVANKVDLKSSACVELVLGVERWCREENIPHLEVSAKDGTGVVAAMTAIAARSLEAKRTKPKPVADLHQAKSFVLGAPKESLADMYVAQEQHGACGGMGGQCA